MLARPVTGITGDENYSLVMVVTSVMTGRRIFYVTQGYLHLPESVARSRRVDRSGAMLDVEPGQDVGAPRLR
jgi:hypothetical protein